MKTQIELVEKENYDLKSNIKTLTDKIVQQDIEFQTNKVGKKYMALLKVFEECQNTWKSENQSLRNLLLSDTVKEDGYQNEIPFILPLEKVKVIIEDVFKETENKEHNYGILLIIL